MASKDPLSTKRKRSNKDSADGAAATGTKKSRGKLPVAADLEGNWKKIDLNQNMFLKQSELLAGLVSFESMSGDEYLAMRSGKKTASTSKKSSSDSSSSSSEASGRLSSRQRKRLKELQQTEQQGEDNEAMDEAEDGEAKETPATKKQQFKLLQKKLKKDTPASSSTPSSSSPSASSTSSSTADISPSTEIGTKPQARPKVQPSKRKGNKQAQQQQQGQKQVTKEEAKDGAEKKQPVKKQSKKTEKKKDNKQKKGSGIIVHSNGQETKEQEQDEDYTPPASEWNDYMLHPLILKGIHELGFAHPTAIQAEVLPAAIRDWKDVVGVAETGSGKTLAFGLPILQRIMEQMDRRKEKVEEKVLKLKLTGQEIPKELTQKLEQEEPEPRGMLALVLTPTRELCLQVADHIKAVAKHTPIKIGALVGGMSIEKQKRILNGRPEIIIATPGRLWELITEGNPHLCDMSQLRFLVLDEADRMVANGHFPELNQIIHFVEHGNQEAKPFAVNFDMSVNKPEPEEGEEGQEGEETKGSGKRKEEGEEDEEDEDAESEEEDEAGEEGEDDKNADEDEDMGASSSSGSSDADEKKQQQQRDLMAKLLAQMDAEDAELDADDANKAETFVYQSKFKSNRQLAREQWKKEKEALAKQGQKKKEEKRKSRPKQRQTFLFSATLMLSDTGREEEGKKKKKKKRSTGSMLDELKGKLHFRGEPHIIDLSTKKQVATTLTEAKIECLDTDKDLYLYYFFLHHHGKSLVFVNSISCLRRVLSLFTLLQFPIWGLHAQLQQRQRLKNLDRFKEHPNGIIVCTDVAARGLDIPDVQYVVHYQMPRSSEIYVHRSGRTARAGENGMSLVLVGAQDQKNYRKICHVLNKTDGIPRFNVDQRYLQPIGERIDLAHKVDVAQHKHNHAQSEDAWYLKAAQEAGLALDDDVLARLNADVDDDEGAGRGKKSKAKKFDVHNPEHLKQRVKAKHASAASTPINHNVGSFVELKQQLKTLLKKPIIPKGVSRSFLTMNKSLPMVTGKDGKADVDLFHAER